MTQRPEELGRHLYLRCQVTFIHKFLRIFDFS